MSEKFSDENFLNLKIFHPKNLLREADHGNN